MDTFSLVFTAAMVASMLVVGRLARQRGLRSLPWVATASMIGPFAIALLYLAEAFSAIKTMVRPRSSNNSH